MNLYSETDYRLIIKMLVEERREIDKGVSFQSVAQQVRIPKSYLSKVVHGTADLNADQLYLVCASLGLNEDERTYMALLLDYARCNLVDRKSEILRRIRVVQGEHLDARRHLQANVVKADAAGLNEYYLDPLLQIVHVSMAIPRFQSDLKALAQDLHVPLNRVAAAVSSLERLGILERKGQRLQIVVQNLHLPTDSVLYHSWLYQVRSLALQRQQLARDKDDYAFSVVFSSDEDLRQNIRARFLEFVKKTQIEAAKAKDSKVFQMNFDLFTWA